MQRPAETTGPPAIAGGNRSLRGVINNIPSAVMMFGGGAGLAGGISLAAVAVNILNDHWASLSSRLSAQWSGSSVEQLENLRKKAEEAAEAFAKISPATKGQTESAKALEDLIAEQPRDQLAHKLGEAIGASALRAPRRKANPGTGIAGAPGVIPVAPENQEAIDEEMLKANRKKAEELLGTSTLPGEKGEDARRTIRNLMKQNPGAFPKGFREDFEKTTPEGREKARVDQENKEAEIGGRKNIKEYDKRQEARDKMLNAEGLEGERLHAEQQQKNAEEDTRKAEQRRMEDIRNREQRTGRVAGGLENSPAARAMLMFGDRASGRKAGEKLIKGSLSRAGITDVKPVEILNELQSKLEEKIQAKSLEKGVDRKTARAMVLEDTFKGELKQKQRAEFTDPVSFAKRMQTDILNQDTPKQQLGVLREIRDVIKTQKAANPPPAVAAAP